MNAADDYNEQITKHLAALEENRATRTVLADVAAERVRQLAKWGPQFHSAGNWALILGEEYGEACEAALRNLFGPGDDLAAVDRIREELIQVAAVAVAWIEAIDREGS